MGTLLSSVIEQFLAITWIEWFGVITGALCVYLAAKENILNWPIAMLSVTTYIYIFYQAKLYGDTLLQFYFLGTSVYGWYYWTFGQSKSLKSERPVSTLLKKDWLIILFVQVIFCVLIGILLDKYTDTDVPFIDSFCTVMSFIAQYLMTRKKLENWLIWVIVDIAYIPLYIHKNLLATAVLYFVFLLIALKGYFDWKRTLTSSSLS
ncbi:nicotinamide riboside transporter PnuC [Pelobium sp.]|nr:nicotinamide riboside transporter PnuC [Pelobium sp.]MDA9554934.1 nicotinamide riboside transporter PnuC [Pelobium sp.]